MPPKRKSTRLSGLRTSKTTLLSTVAAQPAFKVQKGKSAPVSDSKLDACVGSVRGTCKDAVEESQRQNECGAQEPEYGETKEQSSTVATVTIEKALLQRLIDTHMLVLRGQQDLKEEMKNIRDDISKMNERIAQVETTTVQLSGNSATFPSASRTPSTAEPTISAKQSKSPRP